MTYPLTFEQYDYDAGLTATYPGLGDNLTYPTLGLCGEAGEFAEKVKKMYRDDGSVLTEERRVLMLKELGDVMWYLSACAKELGSSSAEVAKMNIDKLRSRRDRDKLHGDGDNR